MTRAGSLALLLPALALTACGAAGRTPAPASTPAPAPASPDVPRIQMPSGAVYRVELATNPEEQAQGLMFRESLPAKSGMLFLFSEPGVHKFWMKNTMIALDMIWMDPSGRVLFVSANTPPCRADPCPSYGPEGPASSVLEISGGLAAREKIVPGATLVFRGVK